MNGPLLHQTFLFSGEDEDIIEGQVKRIIMINCGGTMDIVEFLDPPEDLVRLVKS